MNIICLIISILPVVLLILGIIFVPKIKIKKLEIESFWVVSLIGVILLLIFGVIDFNEIGKGIFREGSINPIKIIILFFSMTIISIILDEEGFFSYLANIVSEKCRKSQLVLLIAFYICISILTVFTSNDIIILTFTPFICALCKNLKISPYPYLISEFVAANTLSMMLVIGNPTNIYLSQAYGIDFFEYLKVMAIPTILAAVLALIILIFVFKKELMLPIHEQDVEHLTLKNKVFTFIALGHLIVCIIFLAISSYINIEMYLISLVLCLSLTIIILIKSFIEKDFSLIKHAYARVPYNLAIFVISMFVIVLSLSKYGFLEMLGNVINSLNNDVFSYGLLSFITCNITNNIPMSVMFSEVIITSNGSLEAVYATIIGSNIGAYFTPLGALAGIMWLDLLERNNVKLTFGKFIKMLMPISVCVLLISLFGLMFCI